MPGCGSFEVRFADGRVSHYIYFEDLPGRRLRSEHLTRNEALEQAKSLAPDELEKKGRGGSHADLAKFRGSY